ncbi:trk system K+ uptake protein TrkH [Prevotella sp. CAG:891]|jgi:trk system potassium uptake protein TrkH|nr:TrkH family potassium uptake protein [Prevotellamassilia sp.]CDE86798.1 trk system K+ uptake protein TrkH [Prevotella sp. CAG:891]
MLHIPIIYKVLGTLLYLLALLMSICFGMSYWFNEGSTHLAFGIPMLIAFVAGALLQYFGRHAENCMGRRDGFLIVSLTWIVFSVIGMLPLIISGCQPRVSAAFFETMSGFTTTGATALDNIDSLPYSILTWRSMTHWIGGMGIVFFTIAVLPNMGDGGTKLFSAESTGLKIGKLHPRISTTARWMWSLYLLLTLTCTAAYYWGGMSLFDAVNHGLSTIGTGGFSTHQDSIAFFKSNRIQWIATLFMFIASINCTLLYLFFVKRRFKDVWHDGELRCFLVIFFTAALSITGILYFVEGIDIMSSLRIAFFNTVSLQSTTGFSDEDFMIWHPTIWLILSFISIIGACAGSTSGGLKCIRVLMVWKLTKTEFRQMLHPHAVLPVRINNTQITAQMGRTVFAFFVVYFILIMVACFFMVAMGHTLLDSFGLAISSFSNIGPSIGHQVGPLGSWSCLNDATLWINSFLMLAGRLEIFSLLLPFTPAFWRDE